MKRLLIVLMLLTTACQPRALHGTQIDPPRAAVEFALTDQNGAAAKLSDYRGQWVMMFFGYTNCPDVCPATLADFKKIRGELGGAASRVRFMMITVDAERDTTARLKEYMNAFDSSFVGLTGNKEALAQTYRGYGVHVEAILASSSGHTSSVDHTSSVYLLDTEGRLKMVYTSVPWRDVLDDLRYLVK
ncbi:MAG: SCO family protein [Chloroflexi bacterium]|nr:SCO family protein [Chloroflexota bacterium]MBI5081690.1 SCO family protein [Chloroflexota bacterium]MBI5713385.1 SCO family protein [Chloroflexota bacterium]